MRHHQTDSQTPAHRNRCCATTADDSRSDHPMKHRATHTYTVTQLHSNNAATQQHRDPETQQLEHRNARSLPHTAARGNQRATYTQTPKHRAPQIHTPLHCTLNVLVTKEVIHDSSAAVHTRPRPRAAASSAATPGGTHNTCSTVSQSLPARTLQQCDTATATRTITGHVSHE
jgi:hypothetical protein